MTVSDPKVAGQIAAPGEEPRFYDDIGCLATAIAGGERADFAFVADHRTGEWVLASNAVLTVVPAVETPMGSHVIAHVSEASRRDDAAAAGGTRTTLTAVVEGARARRSE
jgi:copper chaperone NosL